MTERVRFEPATTGLEELCYRLISVQERYRYPDKMLLAAPGKTRFGMWNKIALYSLCALRGDL
jgi:hypothetical protein